MTAVAPARESLPRGGASPAPGPFFPVGEWLREYARRPLNLALLVLVPVVFVSLSSGALAEFADLLGGTSDLGRVDSATAGWAAAVLSGVAAFFHVSGSREADRRLAIAGMGASRVVVSRLASTLVLAFVASTGALVALAIRDTDALNIGVVGATAMSALIYAGLGVLVGALVRSEMNGSLLIVFTWIFDVFLGPGMGGTEPLFRSFPLHFPTLMMTGADPGYSGPLGDLGWSLVWVVGVLVSAVRVLTVTTGFPVRRNRSSPVRGPAEPLGGRGAEVVGATGVPEGGQGESAALPIPKAGALSDSTHGRRSALRLRVALTAGFRQMMRMPIMWVLIIGLPAGFISASIAATPDEPIPVRLFEDGRSFLTMVSMADVHGAVMVPITVGFLSGLAGLFVILDSAPADRRLSLTEFRPGEILGVRMVAIGVASLVATGVALAVTALSFGAVDWWVFAGANVLVALTYATIGVVIGPLFGRLGGTYLLLVIPFLDVGLAQNSMFDASPPSWGRYLPAHGAVRVMMDGAFTPSFDEYGALFMALGWLTVLGVTAILVFRRLTVSVS